MDVLEPELLFLPNGITYRVNPSTDPLINIKQDEIPNYETSRFVRYDEDFPSCSGPVLKQTIECPSLLLKYVIGKGGEKKKQIEQETHTRIIIPDKKTPNKPILVEALSSVEQLSSALTRIQMIIDSGREKEPFTHFVSIPISSEEISRNFANFKDSILSTGFCQSQRISQALFQNEFKLHITIATLALLSKNEVDDACEILKSLEMPLKDICDSQELKFELSGLEIMNDDPTAVDVLYAKVSQENSEVLQIMIDFIYERFASSGYLQKSFGRDSVKMHVTLMNKRFGQDSSMNTSNESTTQLRNNRTSEQEEGSLDRTFDARGILNQFSDFQFGTFAADKIHLSQRYSTDCKTGFYAHSYILDLS